MEIFPWAVTATSERQHGNLWTHDGTDTAAEGRRKAFCRRRGFSPKQIFMPGIVYGSGVGIVNGVPSPRIIPEMDALITAVPGMVLAVPHHDCFPVFFAEKHGVVGIAHCSWQGILGGIVFHTVSLIAGILQMRFSDLELEINIGPGIRACCFEVKDDSRGVKNFRGYKDFVASEEGKYFVDLPGIMEFQLKSLRMRRRLRVFDSEECTACEENRNQFFSLRRDGKAAANRMVSIIGIRS